MVSFNTFAITSAKFVIFFHFLEQYTVCSPMELQANSTEQLKVISIQMYAIIFEQCLQILESVALKVFAQSLMSAYSSTQLAVK